MVVVVACSSATGSVGPTASPPAETLAAATSVAASPAPSETATPSGTAFASERYRYGLVLPEGWTMTETPGSGGLHPDEPGVDTLRDTARIISIVGEPVPAGSGLERWSCAIGEHLVGEHETPADSTEAIIVAGRPARLSRYHLHIDPYVIHYLNVELINGDMGLTISMESTAGDDAADEAVLRSLLDTVSLS